MQIEANNQDIIKIASLRLKAIVAEVKGEHEFRLKLNPEADLQGFIILLRQPLPSIE